MGINLININIAEIPAKPTHLTPLLTLNNFMYHILLYCLKHEWHNIILLLLLFLLFLFFYFFNEKDNRE